MGTVTPLAQRQTIARYNKAVLGANAQNYIINYEKDPEKWKDALIEVKMSQDRAPG